MLDSERQRALQAVLFHVAFWRSDLAYLGRGLLGSWPQQDIGIVLWSLCVAAVDWQSPLKLTRLCTVPVNGVLDSTWDAGSMAMSARILRPLLWFGLLDYVTEKKTTDEIGEERLYRKSPLFDRFVAFDVRTERPDALHY